MLGNPWDSGALSGTTRPPRLGQHENIDTWKPEIRNLENEEAARSVVTVPE